MYAAFYMVVLVPTRYNPAIRAFYEQLFRAGKAKKVAFSLFRLFERMPFDSERALSFTL